MKIVHLFISTGKEIMNYLYMKLVSRISFTGSRDKILNIFYDVQPLGQEFGFHRSAGSLLKWNMQTRASESVKNRNKSTKDGNKDSSSAV